ncbi:hypothetical protein BV25DRAFT_1817903 [Artomyces pyxidatus]|uniref:Uncharacterized protein n=1 Tax=Artomyces pyxidatus TaxID=48021 RepID=A0ACB8TKT1_9AGAM|nr:hypothetical protein BV25DRAFT_1817903 [Artomyces pyxidatus]
MNTRNEVIVQLPYNTNIEPVLGVHKWSQFLKKWVRNPNAVSYVFEYNYRMNGDPAKHSWREWMTSEIPIPDHVFAQPYPAPSWAAPPPSLINLSLPLPKSRERTPTPKPETELDGVKQEVKAEDPFWDIPYEPSEALRREFELMAARNAENAAGPSVKQETDIKPDISDSYEPSQELQQEFEKYMNPRTTPGPSVKEDPDSKARIAQQIYEPSQDLLTEFEKYTRSQAGPSTANPTVKEDPEAQPRQTSQIRPTFIKPEPVDDDRVPPMPAEPSYSGYRSTQPSGLPPITVKREPMHAGIPSLPPKPVYGTDPRADPRVPLRPGAFPSFKKNKRPLSGDNQEPEKRVKSEHS